MTGLTGVRSGQIASRLCGGEHKLRYIRERLDEEFPSLPDEMEEDMATHERSDLIEECCWGEPILNEECDICGCENYEGRSNDPSFFFYNVHCARHQGWYGSPK